MYNDNKYTGTWLFSLLSISKSLQHICKAGTKYIYFKENDHVFHFVNVLQRFGNLQYILQKFFIAWGNVQTSKKACSHSTPSMKTLQRYLNLATGVYCEMLVGGTLQKFLNPCP